MSGHSKFANIKHKKEKNDAAVRVCALYFKNRAKIRKGWKGRFDMYQIFFLVLGFEC